MKTNGVCLKCEAAAARATESLGLLSHWQGRVADLQLALTEISKHELPGQVRVLVQKALEAT